MNYSYIKGIVALLTICSFIGCKNQNKYTVYGEIKGYGNGEIYIHNNTPNIKKWFSDTIAVVNDKFKLEGSINCPHLVYIFIKQKQNVRGYGFNYFLKSGISHVITKAENVTLATSPDNEYHKEYLLILKKGEKLFNNNSRLRRLRSQAAKAGEKEKDRKSVV